MKTIVKELTRNQKGNVLVMVLILLVVGGLILAPLLGLMSTGLVSGQVYEKKTDELYAADAGVEDAIWKIKNDVPDSYPYEYPEPLVVNDKSVNITIFREDLDPTCGEELRYHIVSTATSEDGSSTTIDAHLSVSYMDLSNLLDNAIISDTYIGIKNGVYVTGNVTSGGEVRIWGDPEDIDGAVTENAQLNWPTGDDLSFYYMDEVDDLNPAFPYTDPLNIAGANITLEALHREGDWTIYNDSDTAGTVTLNGTVYVKGDLEVGVTNKDFTLNLNGKTIFVESASADPQKAIEIGGKCTIIGSGCIIGVGDVYFAPKGDVGSEYDFVLVMSVEGTTTLRPSGTYYGCIAGDLAVDIQSGINATIIHTAPEGVGLNIPWGVGDLDELPPVTGTGIESWEIN